MSNRICSVMVRDHSLIPAEAVVHITVVPERLDAGTEVRGRLMGPRCHFASTVEVAYHLRPVQVPMTSLGIDLRAVIPEASFWSPRTPHLYAGPVELWQDGERCEVVQIRHGLRHVTLGPRGLRINGHPVQLRGRQVTTLDDAGALALREAGYDLVVAPVEEATRGIWEVADRIGLFVLGRGEADSALAQSLSAHPSCLGWLGETEGIIQGEGPGHIAERFAVTRPNGGTNGSSAGLRLDAASGGESSLGVVEG